jgi:uncharacterized protein (TIGR02646 family)
VRRIQSSGMPPGAVARLKTESTFPALQSVPEVRAALAVEQGSFCAYCEQRLTLGSDHNTRIEHFHPQSRPAVSGHCQSQCGASTPADAAIEWTNLLLCCDGSSPDRDPICDVKKHDTDVCDGLRNPKRAPASVDTLVDVDVRGRVSPRAALDAGRAEAHLNDTLNLNHEFLVRNRLRVLTALRKLVGQKAGRKPGAWTAADKAKVAASLRRGMDGKEYGSEYLSMARRYEN